MIDTFGFDEGTQSLGAVKDIGGIKYPLVIATEIDGTDTGLAAKLGGLTETAPASDTASSGLNGRLQRIAQRLTTLIGSTIAVSIASLPLPTGASTSAKQDTGNTSLGNIDTNAGSTADAAITTDASGSISGKLRGLVKMLADMWDSGNHWLKVSIQNATLAVTQSGAWNITNISGTVSLPTGAATSANQSTGNTSVANIDTNAGATSDAIVAAGATGSISAKLRRMTQGLEDLKTLIVLAAGTNLIGKVSASLETSTIYNGTTALTPKFAKITASSSGATTIVSAVTSKKLRVLGWSLGCNAAVNVKWQSHVTPTDITGLYYFAANGGISVPFSPVGYFETVAGEALDINLSGAVAVGGTLVYVEV